MPEIVAEGVRLHYVERAGTGEPIIFLHGHHGTHHAWDDLIEHLPGPYRALAFDLRGCGDSDKPSDGYAPADYARDLVGAATRSHSPRSRWLAIPWAGWRRSRRRWISRTASVDWFWSPWRRWTGFRLSVRCPRIRLLHARPVAAGC
jgi:alpha-beta hydrolase superfamily lysophospholipase